MATSSVPNPAPKAPRVTIPGTRYHRIRKTVQTVCVIVFILLPLFDVMRVDITRQRFYFFGAELWISEFSILFLTMMFLWILIAASAMIYGRFYCGYLCPQMIFSETASQIDQWLTRRVKRAMPNAGERRQWLASRALVYVLGIPPSVFFSFIFISFFVPPADLFQRLLHFDVRTVPGIIGASVTFVTFLDFAFLRQRFCTAICPYGYLQNMLADRNTLLVHFHDPNHQCIHCAKCARACPMGIDIRNGGHQLECTHCAECVDACSEVLGKMGRATVVNYGWGDLKDESAGKESFLRRVGLRDGKRVAILALLTVYATGLAILIARRQPVLVQVMPNRTTLYAIGADGRVTNHFRVLASNRSHSPAYLELSLSGMPSAEIVGLGKQIELPPGEVLRQEFDIAAPAAALQPGMNPIHIEAAVTPAQKPQQFDENFFAPMEGEGKMQGKTQ